MSKEIDESEVKNHYKNVPKKFKEEERHYPNEARIKIKIPFRMCIIGTSGSGKTNCLIEIIEEMNAWDKIIIIAKNTEEPLYATLIDTIQEAEKKSESSILTVGNEITDLPELKSINKKNNTLLIIDDMVNEKDKLLGRVAEYYTMGRKQYVSTIFLSQSYFKIPKIIRDNTGYFVFTKISTDRDLLFILKDFQLGITEEQLLKLFHSAATGFPNFFLIDRETNDKDLVFRKNFKPMKPPDNTETKATSNIVAPALPGKNGRQRKIKQKTPEGKDIERTYYTQEAEPNHPTVIKNKLSRRGREKEFVIDIPEDNMNIDEDDLNLVGMEDIPRNENLMDEGSGIGRRKRRKTGRASCTDKELRRMLRLYGFV